jgi:hypothetical protein
MRINFLCFVIAFQYFLDFIVPLVDFIVPLGTAHIVAADFNPPRNAIPLLLSAVGTVHLITTSTLQKYTVHQKALQIY